MRLMYQIIKEEEKRVKIIMREPVVMSECDKAIRTGCV
jgi:hypothetical protein